MHGEGFLDVGVGTHVHALHLRVVVGLGGEHDKGYVAGERVAAHSAAQLGTVHAGHHPVGDDDIDLVLRQDVECFDAVASGEHLVFLAEVLGEEAHHVVGVVDDEHLLPLAGFGWADVGRMLSGGLGVVGLLCSGG